MNWKFWRRRREESEQMVAVLEPHTREELCEARKETERLERRLRALEYQQRFERGSRS